MRSREKLTVIGREGGDVTYNCKCMGADNQVWKESTFTAPTYEEAKRKCAIFCRGKEASSTSSQKFNNFTSGRTGKRFRKHSGSGLDLVNLFEDVSGCTIPSAYNYDATSTSEEGNCLWYDESVGSGNVLSSYFAACDFSEAGYFLNHTHASNGNTPPLQFPQQCPYINYGCTDPSADNYNPSADQDWNFGLGSIDNPPTLCVYDGQVIGLTSGKEEKKAGKKFRNQTGDWGGISFQCAETPFTSATGEVKTPLGGGGDREIGGGKKNYTCKCIQADGSLTLATISAWSSRAAKRQCSRSGRSCFLESSWGT